MHQRVEPLLVFNVDGASFVDPEDERWELVSAVLDNGALTCAAACDRAARRQLLHRLHAAVPPAHPHAHANTNNLTQLHKLM